MNIHYKVNFQMNHDLLKILSNSNKDIDNQKLMDYLSGHLSGQDTHEVEKWMVESEFVNDAIEGLQEVKNKKNIEALVEQLNTDLHKKLLQKKSRKNKRKLKEYEWIYFAIVLLLLLLTVTWFIIQRLHVAK